MLKPVFFTILLVFFSGIVLAASGEKPARTVIKAYEAEVVVPLAGVKVAPVYLRLINSADHPISLISVTAAEATHVIFINVAPGQRLQEQTQFNVPAKGQLQLQKAKQYLLLTGLKKEIRTGDQLHLVLSFSDKSHITVIATAKSQYDQPHH